MKTASRALASARSKRAATQTHRRAAAKPLPQPDPQTARALKAIKGLKGIV